MRRTYRKPEQPARKILYPTYVPGRRSLDSLPPDRITAAMKLLRRLRKLPAGRRVPLESWNRAMAGLDLHSAGLADVEIYLPRGGNLEFFAIGGAA